MATTDLDARWLGRLPYRWALALQRARRDAIVAGSAPEVLWLLEHDPVITVGRRVVDGLGDEVAGIPVVRTERGGLATWHGPGQLVGYLLADVKKRRWSVRGTVTALEEGILAWLAEQGVAGERRSQARGVWVGGDKICAIGLHFRRGVSMHGFALNLTNGTEGFDHIVPCGITDGGVTSLVRLADASPTLPGRLGVASPTPSEAASSVGRAVLGALRPAF